MEKLPDYMKQCFYVLNNTLNELAFDTFKEQELHIHSYMKKAVHICSLGQNGDIPLLLKLSSKMSSI